MGTLCNNSSILAYCVIIVVKNKSKVLCAFCVYLVLILVVFKFNKQKNHTENYSKQTSMFV